MWAEGSWRVPVVYIADWPDLLYSHAKGLPSNLDPTKLKRAIFIAAAAGWALANLDQEQVPAVERAMQANALEQRAAMLRQIDGRPADARWMTEARNIAELAEAASFARFGLRPGQAARDPWLLVPECRWRGGHRLSPPPLSQGPWTLRLWLARHQLGKAGLSPRRCRPSAAPRDGAAFAMKRSIWSTVPLGRRNPRWLVATVGPAARGSRDYLATRSASACSNAAEGKRDGRSW